MFVAQGYVTAQDRLWQMDGTRRYAAGEMAEVFGPSWVAHDKEQRILLLRAMAERAVAGLAPEERSRLEAYARGVNAFIATHRDRLPIEFRILRYSPGPWTPADSLVIGAHMVELLRTKSPAFTKHLQHCRLFRLDDNGNRILMREYESRRVADYYRRVYEARCHKQLYWVEPAGPEH